MKYIKADRIHDENDDSNDNIVFGISNGNDTLWMRFMCCTAHTQNLHSPHSHLPII